MGSDTTIQLTRENLLAIYLIVLGIAIGAVVTDIGTGAGLAVILVTLGLIDAAVGFFENAF